MARSTQPDQSALTASFQEHVTAFYQSLPPDERTLLEQVLGLAQVATREQADVQGFGAPLGITMTVVDSLMLACASGQHFPKVTLY